jgi:hypothetical protein
MTIMSSSSIFFSAFPPHINLLKDFDIEPTNPLAFLFEVPACGKEKVAKEGT